jgi:hypothetical protein
MGETISYTNLKILKKWNQNLRIFMILASVFFFLFMSSTGPVQANDFNKKGHDLNGYQSHEDNYGDYTFPGDHRGEEGNGATGGIAALLLVLANVTVLLSLILKGINKFFPVSQETRTSISEFNKRQKKYLRGMHYILNPIAICVAVVHYHLSSCRSILPDMALIIFLIIGVLGFLIKFKLSPAGIHKSVYGLHCSSITFFGLIILLAIGHA